MTPIYDAERVEVAETSMTETPSCFAFDCTCQGCVWDG